MLVPTFLSRPQRVLRYVVGLLVLLRVQSWSMMAEVVLLRRDCNCLGIHLGIVVVVVGILQVVVVAAEAETDQVAAVGMMVAVGRDGIPFQVFVVVHPVVSGLVDRGSPSQEQVFVVVACLLEIEIVQAAAAVQAVAEEVVVELEVAAVFANQEGVPAETETALAVVAEDVA